MSLPNSLFFAVKTYSYDGNKFAQKALDAGCRYAVVEGQQAPISIIATVCSGFKRNKVREAPKEAFSLPFVDTSLMWDWPISKDSAHLQV